MTKNTTTPEERRVSNEIMQLLQAARRKQVVDCWWPHGRSQTWLATTAGYEATGATRLEALTALRDTIQATRPATVVTP